MDDEAFFLNSLYTRLEDCFATQSIGLKMTDIRDLKEQKTMTL